MQQTTRSMTSGRRKRVLGWPFKALLVCACSAACGNLEPEADEPPPAGSPGDGGAGGAVIEDPGGGGSAEPATDGGAGAAAPGLGGDSAWGAPNVARPEGSLLPWAVGNTWTYRVTKGTSVTKKTVTIGDAEKVGGVGPDSGLTANHVTTTKGVGEGDHTESWQAPDANDPSRIVRYREQSFGASTDRLELEEYWSPPKLHVDGSGEHTQQGVSWVEEYEETKLEVGKPETTTVVSERWTVVADDETLEVPAGVFEHAIHLRKVVDGAVKEYWYLRGVGKLKEAGSQTEELADYELVEDDP